MPIEPLSRRRFAGTALASLALSTVPARPQAFAPPGATPDTSIATENDPNRRLTIPVTINGRGPFRFVVDTGAERTVVADSTADALGLARGPQVMVAGIIRTVRADSVHLAVLSFGAVTALNMKVPVLPYAQLKADGYLGIDALDGYCVTLDFQNHALEVTQPRHGLLFYSYPPGETLVPAPGKNGHLRALHGVVEGHIVPIFIDTGADVSVGNTMLYDRLRNDGIAYNADETVSLTGITGGIIPARVVTLHTTRLSGLTFEDCEIAIADLQVFDMWGLASTPAVLMGINWLRAFPRVSIDYGRHEFRFNLANGTVVRRA